MRKEERFTSMEEFVKVHSESHSPPLRITKGSPHLLEVLKIEVFACNGKGDSEAIVSSLGSDSKLEMMGIFYHCSQRWFRSSPLCMFSLNRLATF